MHISQNLTLNFQEQKANCASSNDKMSDVRILSPNKLGRILLNSINACLCYKEMLVSQKQKPVVQIPSILLSVSNSSSLHFQ